MKSIVFKALLTVSLGTGIGAALQAQSLSPAEGNRTGGEVSAPKEAVMEAAPVAAMTAPAKDKVSATTPAKPQAQQRDLTVEEQEAAAVRAKQVPTREGVLREIQAKVTAEPGTRAAFKQESQLVHARIETLQAARGEFSEPSAEETLLKEHLGALMEKLGQ
jgi:hypothetical protein